MLHPDELVDDLERALIGAVLVEGTALPSLRPEEFFLERHRTLWSALGELTRPDPVLLYAQLRQAGTIDASGGAAYLAQLIEEGALALQIPDYAARIRAAATGRTLRALGHELTERGFPADEVRRRLDALPPALSGHQLRGEALWQAVQLQWLEVPILWGIPAVDRFARMLPGDLVVVGARTSQGKTALCVSSAMRMVEAGLRVSYYSLETPAMAIWRRAIAGKGRVALTALRFGAATATEFQVADAMSAWLVSQPFTVRDTKTLGGKTARALLDALRQEDADVVMVDHAQEIVTTGEHRALDLGSVFAELKEVALLRPAVLIVAAQLSRQSERHAGLPVLADLKESGGIEERADTVLLLHHWVRAGATDRLDHELEVIVAKNRDGETGRTTVRFERRFGVVEALR